MVVRTEKIKVTNLRKVFPSHEVGGENVIALDHVDAEIQPGEFVSLIGPSGCGKTTWLRLIAGLEEPTSGSVYIGEQQVQGPGRDRGLVFQDPNLFPWLTVKKNIEFGLNIKGKLTSTDQKNVTELIELVGLQGFENAYPYQLSGGMAHRAAIARALVNDPEVLLFDEPFGALDAFTRMKLQSDVLRIWQERQTTMVLVTHDVEEAVFLGQRVFAMTPRPAHVKEVVPIPLTYPRKRDGRAFIELKEHVLGVLDFQNL
ncbi:ABC transporter ATP-binding protein [Periweissella cryptocerci]|uniref:ABC transporter ATP-binding protein n=1 Tax=Periweissella cryptocerci TaxID=2506420 RepID=A0A4P6YTS4_9LACO|nr:ABC transporter ATP-binding protein [Periweissella cryptocerci]QBO36083.1 ABC transporter ATP-binding protein [Periweissella cryptocerci]